jgi:hypothetical protein
MSLPKIGTFASRIRASIDLIAGEVANNGIVARSTEFLCHGAAFYLPAFSLQS